MTCVGISGRVKVFAVDGQLFDQALELGHAALGRAAGGAIEARRVTTGLTRIQPILQGAGEQAVGHVPQVGIFVGVGNLIAQVDSLGKGRIETFGGWRS